MNVVPPFRIALTMRGFGIVRRCGYLLLNPPDKDASSDITSTITSSIDRSNAVILKMILSHLFQQSIFVSKITAKSNIGESESNTHFMSIHFFLSDGQHLHELHAQARSVNGRSQSVETNRTEADLYMHCEMYTLCDVLWFCLRLPERSSP